MMTNANTYYTRTLYVTDGLNLEPSIAHLSQVLQHTHFPEEKVEHEMKAVRREAVTKLDNVDQLHGIASSYAMFGTPYGRRVLGYHDNLNFDSEKLKRLHERYYKLGRMSLVVSGKAKLDEVAQLATRYFEADSQSYDPSNDPTLPVILGEHKTTGLVREDSRSVRVNVAYPMSPEFRKQYNNQRLVYNIAANAIRDTCFEALRYDKGISYDGGVSLKSFNHPNAWSLDGYVTTDKENVSTALDVFTDVFGKSGSSYSDDDITGVLATYKFLYSRSVTSISERAGVHTDRLQRYLEPQDIRVNMRRLDKTNIADVRAAIDEITEFAASTPRYTHLTGKRGSIGDVERIIEQSEIA